MMDELIKKYQYLVDIIINKYFPVKRNDEDFKQYGMIALWEAIKKFDESYSIKFETFASACIKKKLLRELRRENNEKNFLNIVSNVISLDGHKNEDENNMYDYVKGNDNIDYIDLKNFIDSLDECEIQIIRLKQKRKTDTQIKNSLNLSRRKYEKKLKSAKEKLKKNVL